MKPRNDPAVATTASAFSAWTWNASAVFSNARAGSAYGPCGSSSMHRLRLWAISAKFVGCLVTSSAALW